MATAQAEKEYDGTEDTAVTSTKEDRGDVVNPELDVDNLKDLVKDAPSEDPPEPAATAKEEAKPQPQHIPKARFDEVNSRKNELAEQLAEANRQIEELSARRAPSAKEEKAQAFDADAQESAYIDALISGDTEAAKAIRREINANLVDQARAAAQADAESNHAAVTLQSAAAQASAAYPYLDTEEGEQALELILASRDAKIAQGMHPADALTAAVALIAPKFAPDSNSDAIRFAEAKPAGDTRTAAAMARGAADSNAQPPSMQTGTGNRASAGRVNVSEMTEEQFENMSTAEKKRLRGDS